MNDDYQSLSHWGMFKTDPLFRRRELPPLKVDMRNTKAYEAMLRGKPMHLISFDA